MEMNRNTSMTRNLGNGGSNKALHQECIAGSHFSLLLSNKTANKIEIDLRYVNPMKTLKQKVDLKYKIHIPKSLPSFAKEQETEAD